MLLHDITFSLLIVSIAVIFFMRLVQDYRLVYTVGKLVRKKLRVEYRDQVTVPLNLYQLCRGVEIIDAWCRNCERVEHDGDTFYILNPYPEIVRGKVELYVKLRIYGMLDSYEIVRKVELQM